MFDEFKLNKIKKIRVILLNLKINYKNDYFEV